MRLKAISSSVSMPTKWLAAQSTAHALRHQLGKHAFSKENEKNICVKLICKILEIYRYTTEFFSLLGTICYSRVSS